MKNLKIFNVCVVLCVALCVFFTGCKASIEDEDTSNKVNSSNQTYDISLNVYDAVLAAQAKAGRSILPDVTSASLYFSVVATNAETSPTETVYYACQNAGATQSITLKLKASSYWYITVYGTEQSGVVGTGTDETTEAQAITRVSGAAIVSGI